VCKDNIVNDEPSPVRASVMRPSACFALPPVSIAQMVNIFSEVVFAETLPNPTVVIIEHVKYRAVTYNSKWIAFFNEIFIDFNVT
jgi:hypothetical protein